MRPYLLAVPALALSLAACVGPGGGGYPTPIATGPDANSVSIARELGENDRQVDRARDNPEVSRSEGRALRREQNLIGSLADRYAADGVLTDAERTELEFRSQALQSSAGNAPFVTENTQSGGKPSKKPK